MATLLLLALAALVFNVCTHAAVVPPDSTTEYILMKGAKPKTPDAYLCSAYSVDKIKKYIYKFEAVANASTAHHMLLYGCDGEPFSNDPIWNCPSMCKSSQATILFAWAKNAPPTVLPEDVGLRIGTTITTLVLQVHYARSFEETESEDHSGIKIYITTQKPQYVAGIYILMAAYFSIPKGSKSYPVDVSCTFNDKKSIFPFAYRTHAHGLGRVITGYQFNGSHHEIGKGNPQWPQAFYSAKSKIEVKEGDVLAARCTYDSTSMSHPVSVGSTGKDEMCNFYIMFYTDSSVVNPYGQCVGDFELPVTGNNFPKDVSDPLPPNPDLEEEAKGHHHHGGMTASSHKPSGDEDVSGDTITDSHTEDILMRGAKPAKSDAYLCTAYPLTDKEYYIYKFEALANASTAHHMLLYGCDGEPASTDQIWNCPPMCDGKQATILFAWAKNAPPTVLPEGVGLRIGSSTSIKTLVLQVHYARSFQESEAPDHSGIRIHTTLKKQKFVAGVFLLMSTSFSIPQGESSYAVDISCKFDQENSIFPFAYRTHAHGLGRVITGYQNNGTYHQIGKGNPQWPQAFYPVKDIIEVKPGDYLAARCTYDSTSMSHAVSVGATGNDEMCNFYIMFYTDSSVLDPHGDCSFNEFPQLTGGNFPKDVSIPLPPNPDLEEEAKGNHHHGAMTGSSHGSSDHVETPEEPIIADSKKEHILMRGAKPSKPDAYLCASYAPTEEEYYIHKFEAMAQASTAHHMLLYGCDGEPFSDQQIWNCPLMCKDQQATVLFAWARNAPPTVLPKDVGLRIGSRTSIKTLVLQVHYARSFTDSEPPDYSGIALFTTRTKPKYVAGIYFLMSPIFTIPPGEASYPIDVSCTFAADKSIFPFAYRTHAHGLGRVITGYQHNGSYHEIGKGNPQWPQAFYPVKDLIEVKPGDGLAARCTYDSTTMSHSVSVGSTGNDEMCNFYIMFYTDSSVINPYGQCTGDRLPDLTGQNFPPDVSAPLPPNPELEEVAKGTHHHGGMGGSDPHGDGTQEGIAGIMDSKTQEILMRGAKPKQPDAYLCTAYPVFDKESYIYKFEALANASVAHHILLYGCEGEPYSDEAIWNCPAMCKATEGIILFAWAKNAPPTVLPKDVGLRIGSDTIIKTLVLQVHYAKSFSDEEAPDHSGIKIYTTQTKQPFVAGIYFMASMFVIPSGVPAYPVDVSCRFDKTKSIFPFAYRTHAHALGRVITGYQYNGSYHEIGKGNPQWPQAFYPVKDKIEVKPGEYLAARCTYDSTSMTSSVKVGSTGNDEMCNFYIMFYTDSSVLDPYGKCSGNFAPQLTGDNFPKDVSVPLPPNPELEEEAKGQHPQHHSGMKGIHFDHNLVFNSTWPEQKIQLGQIGGVATDRDGNVYIFHRGSRTWTAQSFSYDNNFQYQDSPIPEDVIVILDTAGRLIRKFGAGQYFMPHGIEVDKQGNIWLTDVALHQVFKIPAGETKPTLTLGNRFQHSENLTCFCKPTDVAVLSNGDFFVSDGYCNSRVLKFSKDGQLIKAFGQRNLVFSNAPPAGVFDIPHSITVSEENNLVCVADRENGRVQCFDLDGNFKHMIKHPQFGPRLFAIEQCPEHGGILYAVNGPAYDGPPDFSVQGFTLDINTGDLLEMWNVPEHLKNPHDVCVHPASHSIYIGELNPTAVWKLTRLSPAQPVRPVVIAEESTQPHPGETKLSAEIINNLPANYTVLDGSSDSSSDFTPSVVIGILLVIPVVLLLVITLLVRAHHSGKLKCYGHGKKPRVFNLQGIMGNSHKGFDPLSTEESDHEGDPDDSDHKEYLAPQRIKSKA